METPVISTGMIIQMVSNVIGGLYIFLLGMKYLSDGVQAVAGSRMRKMISMVTDNRLAACGTGLFVTSIIQSSSVTTVMLIGLVNAGVMSLQQSIGVIIGADIGTTITAWIVAINITKYGLLITGIFGLFYLFSRNERNRFISMLVMGLGMVFFGLLLMEKGVEPLRSHQGFIALFSSFSPKSYLGVIKCVIIGALVTGIIQSSSATIAMTITLARAGVIDFDTSVALVLGENIGTTVTAFLASLNTTMRARTVAYAHITIKVVAVSLVIPFFFLYLRMLGLIMPSGIDIATRIALSHSIFNILLAITFLPFTHLLTRGLEYLFKEKVSTGVPALTHLDSRLLETPMISIEQSRREVIRMGEIAGKMMDSLRDFLKGSTEEKELVDKLFNQEQLLDRMQEEITIFLTNLLSQELVSSIAREAQEQLRQADEYESVSDYIVSILKLNLRLKNAELTLDKEEVDDMLEL
ncbi:MAG: Na/Pi cotransporter family protein, partial [Fibrobacter sp.]|nr:Na/Pi cotransporter family protein [Fibrobacter sp.]